MSAETKLCESLDLFDTRYRAEWLQSFAVSGCLLSSGPEKVWIGWGTTTRTSGRSQDRFSIFAPDFLLTDSAPWVLYENWAEVPVEELIALLRERPSAEEPMSWLEPSGDEFAQVFNDIQARIAAGALVKAVPVVASTSGSGLAPQRRLSVAVRVLELARSFPMFAYGFWTDDGEGMVGATPELLFEQADAGKLRTMALAGTRSLQSEETPLLEDLKERLEHQVVIDGIVNLLQPFGTVNVGDTTELRLPTLSHLHTPLELEPTRPTEFEEWARTLHPTPALGAWPRKAGWQWLRAQSNSVTRRRFGAPFGAVPPNSDAGKCVVAIRNVQWTADEAMLITGCGIVGPSRLGREWDELHVKIDAVRKALGV